MQVSSPLEITSEMFPINTSILPPLMAYQVQVRNGDLATIGGKLSYRFQKKFQGHWVWSAPWIITDKPQSNEILKREIELIWREQPQTFHGLLNVRQISTWQPTVQVLADFVARGLWQELKLEVTKVLSQWNTSLGKVRVYRICDVRGWEVQKEAALSISISSNLLTNQDVQGYIRSLRKMDYKDDLVELMVADKESTLKGIIIDIAGSVVEHRTRLLSLVGDSPSKKYIEQAADDEIVVQVHSASRIPYDYVARQLQIIVRTADYDRFGIDGSRATAQLRLAPQERSNMMSQVAKLARDKGLISRAYSSAKQANFFLNTSTARFKPELLVGNNKLVSDLRDSSLRAELRRNGLYRRITPSEEELRIGVLNALSESPQSFLTSLQNELRAFRFLSQIVHIESVSQLNRASLDVAIQGLRVKSARLILALFPDNLATNSDEMHWGPYDHFKSLTIGVDVPSQVVGASTMQNSYALGNIVLGMLSKLGNIPYILAKPLPYADMVVGIDIARRRKTKLSGSLNATAIARIYQSTGEFLQYVIHDAQLEGETIPADVLHALFPSTIFRGKRVVIHRDGLFRGNEKQALKVWAAQLDAQFHLVELLKTGTPRLYGLTAPTTNSKREVKQPYKGSALKLNDYEAFLVSTPPPFDKATANPIHVRSESPFPIEQAIHSVLALTLLHYGSLRLPRLPVSIHYSDEIAYLALKGIKPKSLEGNIPFWL